jgi:hypothetical protein
VIGKYIFDLFNFFILYMMLTFLCLLSFSFWLHSFDGRGHHRQVNQVLCNLLHLHYPGIVIKGVGRSEPVTT